MWDTGFRVVFLGLLVLTMTCFGPLGCQQVEPSHRAVDIQAVDAERADPIVWGILNTIRGWFGWETPEGTRPNEDEREGTAIDELHRDDFSHIGRAVIDVLEREYASEKLVTWNFSADSTFGEQSVLQTPDVWGMPAFEVPSPDSCRAEDQGCDVDFGLVECETTSDCYMGGICRPVRATVTQPGQEARTLCVGHSDDFYDELYDTMIEAESYLDIASLTQPDGRFEAAIRNALTYLSNTGRVVTARYLYGALPRANTDEVIDSLMRDVKLGSALKMHVGAYRIGVTSWNHAKIIAVDGKVLITGGHNFWDQHYLKTAPVHDLSIRLTGTPADDAHYFINQMWAHTCAGYWWWSESGTSVFPATAPDCPEDYDGALPALSKTGARVISVARLGEVGEDPADLALIEMIRSAQSSIRLSNQDIGPIQLGVATVTDWPVEVMQEIVDAVKRDVDVYIVLSNPDSIPGGLNELSGTYGNGWTAIDVASMFLSRFLPEGGTGTYDNLYTELCEHLHVSTLRFSDDEQWGGGENIGNHAKFMIVDEVAFYLGSQNIYPANLAEHGVIVDDSAMTSRLMDTYWNPMWNSSKRTAVSGFEAPACNILH